MSELTMRERKLASLLRLASGRKEVSESEARGWARMTGLSVGAAVSALKAAGVGVSANQSVAPLPAPAVKEVKGIVSAPKTRKVVRPASGPATVKLGAQCPELGNLLWQVDPEVLAAARQVVIERELLRREELKAARAQRRAELQAVYAARLTQRIAGQRVVWFLLWVAAHSEDILAAIEADRERELLEKAQEAAHSAAIRFFPKGSSGYQAAYEAALQVALRKAGL